MCAVVSCCVLERTPSVSFPNTNIGCVAVCSVYGVAVGVCSTIVSEWLGWSCRAAFAEVYCCHRTVSSAPSAVFAIFSFFLPMRSVGAGV